MSRTAEPRLFEMRPGFRYLVCRIYVPFVPGGWGVIDTQENKVVWYREGSRRAEADQAASDLAKEKADGS
jgi:hypothetical protein